MNRKELALHLASITPYKLKEGTNSSLISAYFADLEVIPDRKEKAEAIRKRTQELKAQGKQVLLPIKLSFITNEETAKVANTGRGAKSRVGQIKSTFTRIEESPYKIAKPYRLCTSIWAVEGYNGYFWGTIGITPQEGAHPKDNGDLVIFHTFNWKEVNVYIFEGLAVPNNIANLQEVVEFLKELEK